MPIKSSLLYDELDNIYKKTKKTYDRAFESKNKNWRQKHNHKNLKDLDYQPDQLQQSDQLKQPDESIPQLIKITKSRFNTIQSMITNVKRGN